MAIATINDTSIYYEIHGEGEPLILIHGFANNHTAWANVLPELSRHYQVILFDNRGSGESADPDYPYSIDLIVNDILGLMDYLSLDAAHVIGHSMGGMLAQAMAYQHPQRIKKLVIEASSYKINPHILSLFQAQLKLQQAGVEQRLLIELIFPVIFAARFYQEPEVVAAAIDAACSYPHPMTISGYKNQLAALLDFNSQHYLSAIHQPCLVLAGKEDMMTPHDDGKYLADHIPNAQLVSFEQTAHMIHLESPDKFLMAVIEFLSD